MKYIIQLPNGTTRQITHVKSALAQKVIKLAAAKFDEAKNLRDTDWTAASNRWIQASQLEKAAEMIDRAISD